MIDLKNNKGEIIFTGTSDECERFLEHYNKELELAKSINDSYIKILIVIAFIISLILI